MNYLVDGEITDVEAQEAAMLVMRIRDSKIRRAAIEQIRILAGL